MMCEMEIELRNMQLEEMKRTNRMRATFLLEIDRIKELNSTTWNRDEKFLLFTELFRVWQNLIMNSEEWDDYHKAYNDAMHYLTTI